MVKYYSLLLALIGFISLSFTSSIDIKYEDESLSALKRLSFGRNYTNLITKDKVEFAYSNEKGVYCLVKEDLYAKEFVFEIPRRFILSSYDIFPFKFELKEPILTSLKSNHNRNETIIKFPSYLFALNLMFMKYENKAAVNNYLRETERAYYIPSYTPEVELYIDSLPKVTFTSSEYKEEERRLQNLLGLTLDTKEEMKEVHQTIINYIKTHMKKDAEYILPWIADLEMFKYFSSIILSRSFRSNIYEYEKLIGKNMTSLPKGNKHKQVITELSPEGVGCYLIPFIDFCNHKNSKDYQGKNKIDFLINVKKDKIKFAFSKEFHTGEDYEYSYMMLSPNEKLVSAYGFYVEDNVQSSAMVNFPISKQHFPKYKHDLSVKLRFFDSPFDHFYSKENEAHQTANMNLYLNRVHLDERILNVIRVQMVPNKEYDEHFITSRLSENKILNYYNEIASLTFYRYACKYQYNSAGLKLDDTLYSLQTTANYYNNRTNTPRESFLYRLRTNLMQVGRENKKIILTHIKLVEDKMRDLLSDQFRKLRNHFITNTEM